MPDPWIAVFTDKVQSGRINDNHRRMDEAIAIKQAHIPAKIYKYRCVTDSALRNLKEDTVWLASPDDYNDPYDCGFQVSDEEILPILRQTLNDEHARISGEAPPIPMDPQHAEKLLKDALEKLQKWRGLTKICSFSAAKDVILMWSHYGDHHRGFCIEYDLEALKPRNLFRQNLYPVIYSPQLYSLTPYLQGLASADRGDFQVNAPLLSVLHKYEGWDYEQEWRALFVSKTPLSNRAQEVPKPSRVFLGAKMSDGDAKRVADICAAKGIEVSKMRMALDKFRLEPEPYIPSI
jgi:hypothetical protein